MQTTLFPKFIYFFLALANSSCYAFRIRFFKDSFGIEPKYYGLMAAVLSVCTFTLSPCWAMINDRFKNARVLIMGCVFLQLVSFQMLLLVPRFQGLVSMGSALAVSVFINCFNAGLYPMVDRKVVDLLLESGKVGDRRLFGKQRMFGTLGDGVMMFFLAFLIKFYGYEVLFVAVAASHLGFLYVCWKCVPRDSKDLMDEPKKGVSLKSISKLLKNREIMMLILVGLLNGTARSLGSHFFVDFMEDSNVGLGGEKMWVSVCSVGSAVVEILMFFSSEFFLTKFGVRNLLILAQVAMAIRMAIEGFVPTGTTDPIYRYLVAIAELFKGISFGAMTTSGVLIASSESPTDLKTTAQGLYSGVYYGLAPCMAGLIGFVVLQPDQSWLGFYYSGVFRIGLVLSVLALILSCFEQILYHKKASDI